MYVGLTDHQDTVILLVSTEHPSVDSAVLTKTEMRICSPLGTEYELFFNMAGRHRTWKVVELFHIPEGNTTYWCGGARLLHDSDVDILTTFADVPIIKSRTLSITPTPT